MGTTSEDLEYLSPAGAKAQTRTALALCKASQNLRLSPTGPILPRRARIARLLCLDFMALVAHVLVSYREDLLEYDRPLGNLLTSRQMHW
jgi:hypothetical protein